VRTTHPGHAAEAARDALQGGERYLVAAGGDGTVHEVVNGMLQDDQPIAEDAVLGVVAAGSGCDFVQSFGLPGDPVHAARHLAGDSARRIDVGKVTSAAGGAETIRYFPNIAEAGLGARW
jgi:diacylglycerol kinase (ATP)